MVTQEHFNAWKTRQTARLAVKRAEMLSRGIPVEMVGSIINTVQRMNDRMTPAKLEEQNRQWLEILDGALKD